MTTRTNVDVLEVKYHTPWKCADDQPTYSCSRHAGALRRTMIVDIGCNPDWIEIVPATPSKSAYCPMCHPIGLDGNGSRC